MEEKRICPRCMTKPFKIHHPLVRMNGYWKCPIPDCGYTEDEKGNEVDDET